MTLKTNIIVALLAIFILAGACKQTPDSPLGVAESAKKAITSGNPGAIFAMLPASYKKDLNDLASGYANAFDQETYENLAQIPGKLIAGVEKGKKKLKKNKMVKRLAGKKTDLDKAIKGLGQLWSALDDAGITSHSKMKSIDLQKVLDSEGKNIIAALNTLGQSSKKGDLNKITAGMKDATFKVLEENDTSAVIEFKSKKRSKKVTFVKVENKWIPADLQKSWPKMMKRSKKSLKRFKKMMKKRGKKLKKNSKALLKLASDFEKSGSLKVVKKAARLL